MNQNETSYFIVRGNTRFPSKENPEIRQFRNRLEESKTPSVAETKALDYVLQCQGDDGLTVETYIEKKLGYDKKHLAYGIVLDTIKSLLDRAMKIQDQVQGVDVKEEKDEKEPTVKDPQTEEKKGEEKKGECGPDIDTDRNATPKTRSRAFSYCFILYASVSIISLGLEGFGVVDFMHLEFLTKYAELRDTKYEDQGYVQMVETKKNELKEVKNKFEDYEIEYHCRTEIKQLTCDALKEWVKPLKEKMITFENDLSNACCNTSMTIATRCPHPDSFVGVLNTEENKRDACDFKKSFCTYVCIIKELFIKHIDPLPLLSEVFNYAIRNPFALSVVLIPFISQLFKREEARFKAFFIEFLYASVLFLLTCAFIYFPIYLNLQSEQGFFVQRIGEKNVQGFLHNISKFIVQKLVAH